jgi:putative tryptophan/tyrosine transport system substrate-binding protein
MAGLANPVESGLVESLAHPGGNVTGVDGGDASLSSKRLGLLVELIPALARVAVLVGRLTAELPKWSRIR